MDDDKQVLEDAEIQAIRSLQKELEQHVALAHEAIDVIGIALESLPRLPLAAMPQSLKVTAALLIRIVNDIRSTVLLAVRGYAIQAVSLTSSIHEAAFMVAYIGSDDKLAQEWIDHDDPNTPFRPAKDLTRQALKKLEIPNWEEHLRSRYNVYRQICMGKHLNPLLQKQFDFQFDEKGPVLASGPNLSEAAIQASWFALEHAVFLATMAVTTFGNAFDPASKHQALLRRIGTLRKHREELASEAEKRGWNVDALAEKWRK